MSNAPSPAPAALPAIENHVAMIVARLIVGGVFIWLSLSKIAEPQVFLKLIREYQLLPESPPVFMNLTAVVLPWIEMLCGVLLILGVWVRGAAALMLMMLIAFTSAVALRAVGVYNSEDIAFCAIKFDCGCGGGGEIPICDKLRENTALMGLALIAVVSRSRCWAIESLPEPRRSD